MVPGLQGSMVPVFQGSTVPVFLFFPGFQGSGFQGSMVPVFQGPYGSRMMRAAYREEVIARGLPRGSYCTRPSARKLLCAAYRERFWLGLGLVWVRFGFQCSMVAAVV